MDLSMFLAKLLGLYFLIIAFEILVRKHELEGAVKNFASSKGLIVFSGSLSLLLGLAIVIGHPVYEMDFTGLITLIGYLLILRGIWRITFPSRLQKKLYKCFHKGYWGIFLLFLVLGAYLTYMGFNQAMTY
ncbi:MAG TPA: hypothetical protein VMR37_00065 [Rhabdochlamydiaceae bacterium]|nr:hypothetical protein [Rhabdochlamydiaceae bacterium]